MSRHSTLRTSVKVDRFPWQPSLPTFLLNVQLQGIIIMSICRAVSECVKWFSILFGCCPNNHPGRYNIIVHKLWLPWRTFQCFRSWIWSRSWHNSWAQAQPLLGRQMSTSIVQSTLGHFPESATSMTCTLWVPPLGSALKAGGEWKSKGIMKTGDGWGAFWFVETAR